MFFVFFFLILSFPMVQWDLILTILLTRPTHCTWIQFKWYYYSASTFSMISVPRRKLQLERRGTEGGCHEMFHEVIIILWKTSIGIKFGRYNGQNDTTCECHLKHIVRTNHRAPNPSGMLKSSTHNQYLFLELQRNYTWPFQCDILYIITQPHPRNVLKIRSVFFFFFSVAFCRLCGNVFADSFRTLV